MGDAAIFFFAELRCTVHRAMQNTHDNQSCLRGDEKDHVVSMRACPHPVPGGRGTTGAPWQFWRKRCAIPQRSSARAPDYLQRCRRRSTPYPARQAGKSQRALRRALTRLLAILRFQTIKHHVCRTPATPGPAGRNCRAQFLLLKPVSRVLIFKHTQAGTHHRTDVVVRALSLAGLLMATVTMKPSRLTSMEGKDGSEKRLF